MSVFTSLQNARIAALEPLDRNTSAARFQYLFDAQADGEWGPIILGPWTYSLGTTQLTCKSNNVAVYGCGRSSVLGWSGSPGGIQIKDSSSSTETISTVWRDFVLDGGSAVTGADYGLILGNGAAPSFKTGSGLFENILVQRFKLAGVQLQYTALGRFIKCRFASNRHGVWAAATYDNGVTTTTFDGCEFASNVKCGLFAEQANSITLMAQCQIEDNGEQGVLWYHGGGGGTVFRNINVLECYIEDNGTTAGVFPDMRFERVSTVIQNTRVRGCIFSGINPDGNLSYNAGTHLDEDNEFLSISTNCVKLDSSTECNVASRGIRDPTTIYTIGANAPWTYQRQQNNTGVVQHYDNQAGTITRAGYRPTTGTTVTHVLKDKVLAVSASGGATTVNLLSASSVGRGYPLEIIKTDATANAVTIDPNGAQTINGAATLALAAQYDKVKIISDGTNWLRLT